MFLTALLLAITLRDPAGSSEIALRTGCSASDDLVASFSAGTAVQIRFALSDGTGCFKVQAHGVEGYVHAQNLQGLEQFERERRAARDTTEVQILNGIAAPRASARSPGSVQKAAQLISANQPRQALELLKPMLPGQRNPDVLALAGLAAYRSDDLRSALGYWKDSLELRPDPALESLYRRVERETGSQKDALELFGLRVLLRYESSAIPSETARRLLGILDEEVGSVSGQLGCATSERLVAVVQSRQAYLQSTDAAEWSAGQYDGRIHAAIPEQGAIGSEMRRVLTHEVVHACLGSLSPNWPAWFQEGLAQKLSGDRLNPALQAQLRQLAAQHELPRLENLAQSWSRMSERHARLAYALALAAADLLFEQYASYGIRNVVANPDRLPGITADLDRRLGL